jgi:hypothetical protein
MSRGPSLKRTVEALVEVARKSHAAGFTVKLPDGTEVTWNATDTMTADPPESDHDTNDFDTILQQRKKKRREAKP